MTNKPPAIPWGPLTFSNLQDAVRSSDIAQDMARLQGDLLLDAQEVKLAKYLAPAGLLIQRHQFFPGGASGEVCVQIVPLAPGRVCGHPRELHAKSAVELAALLGKERR